MIARKGSRWGRYGSCVLAAWTAFAFDAAVLPRKANAATAGLELVSITPAGTPGNGWSGETISATGLSETGRFVVFSSGATNIVPGVGGQSNVFIRDILNASTSLVSGPYAGVEDPTAWSLTPSVAANGDEIAFASGSTKIVPGDTNDAFDVFVRNRLDETTRRVSVDSLGQQLNTWSNWPRISRDGRFVAFLSEASPGAAASRLYVKDLGSGVLDSLLVDPSVARPDIASGGRYVVFSTRSTLLPTDTNASEDVYRFDRATRAMAIASLSSAGLPGIGDSSSPAISSDGRYVVFQSAAALSSQDLNTEIDVYRRDLISGITTLVSTHIMTVSLTSHVRVNAAGATGGKAESVYWPSQRELLADSGDLLTNGLAVQGLKVTLLDGYTFQSCPSGSP